MSISIVEAEESIQNALEWLRSKPLNQQLAGALAFLAPEGYHPVVELQEDGRKKRRTASAENWTPETGEILISFSKDASYHAQEGAKVSPPRLLSESPNLAARQHRAPIARSVALNPRATSSMETKAAELDFCNALEEVEREGRAFVALKWFRDEVLPSKGFSWAVQSDERQAVLAAVLDKGLVVTSRIANPRSPFPTTTIRLNRARVTASGARRFTPVRIQGEPLSSTLLRDRGER